MFSFNKYGIANYDMFSYASSCRLFFSSDQSSVIFSRHVPTYPLFTVPFGFLWHLGPSLSVMFGQYFTEPLIFNFSNFPISFKLFPIVFLSFSLSFSLFLFYPVSFSTPPHLITIVSTNQTLITIILHYYYCH